MELREREPRYDDSNTNTQQDLSTSQGKSYLLKCAGVLCTFSGALLEAVSVGCAQALGGYVPHFQLNLWRFLAQFIISVIIVACLKKDIRVNRSNIPHMVIVCVAYNVVNVAYYGAAVYIAAGTLVGFDGTIYLLLTTVISIILNRQCPKLHVRAAVVTVLAGVLLLTQPEILFGDSEYNINPVCPQGHIEKSSAVLSPSQDDSISVTPNFQHENSSAPQTTEISKMDNSLGYIYIAISVVAYVVFTFTINQKLQSVNAFVLSFWIAASGVSMSLILMAIFERPMLPQHCSCQLLLAGHAISVSGMNICDILAIILISPQLFSLISNSRLGFMFCAQYTVLHDVNPGYRNVMEIVGAIAVMLGSCLSPIYSLCKDDKRLSDTEENQNLDN